MASPSSTTRSCPCAPTIRRRFRSVALHPVCSLVKMNLIGKLEGIARFCCDRITVPVNAGCCGFAGDRGFLFPELTASATRREAAEVSASQHDGFFSSSRTCEVGNDPGDGSDLSVGILVPPEQATRD